MQLTGLSEQIFLQRYAMPDENEWSQCASRVGHHIARTEVNGLSSEWAEKFSGAIDVGDFMPGGRILFGAGRQHFNMLNCYRLHPEDTVDSIAKMIRDTYLISCGGGGIGYNFSSIRPKGDDIQNIRNSAPGAVSVMKMVNEVGNHVRSGKNRRTALIAILNVDHPDLFEFLHVKLDLEELNNFNISVGITNDFIKAVKRNKSWVFKFNGRAYHQYKMTRINPDGSEVIKVLALNEHDALGRANACYRLTQDDTFRNIKQSDVMAREIWDTLITNSWKSGDPGIYNLDFANSFTNVSYFENLDSPNPCHVGSAYLLTTNGYKTFKELYDSQEQISIVQDARVTYCGPIVDNNNPNYWKVDNKQTGHVINAASPVQLTQKNAKTVIVTFNDGLVVQCTPDHHIATKYRGMIEAQNLEKNEAVLVADTAIYTNRDITRMSDTYRLGFLYGMFVGDGTMERKNNVSKRMQLCLWGEDRQYTDMIIDEIEYFFNKNESLTQWNNQSSSRTITASYIVQQDNKTTIKSTFLVRLFKQYGLIDINKKQKFSSSIIKDNDLFAGFLTGLFLCDGTVCVGDKWGSGMSLRIASSEPDMLYDIQRKLLEFGSHGRIYKRRDTGIRTLPDGKGGKKAYQCRADYELIFGGRSRDRFASIIDLMGHKLDRYNKSRAFYQSSRDNYWTKVLSVEEGDNQDVYCLQENNRRTIVVNGITTRRCGEIPLPPYGNCCLGHVNLSNMYIEKTNDVDWKRLARAIRIGVRFLDNTLTANHYPIPECKTASERTRRIGLGVTGLHYLLLKLGYTYGDEKCLEFLDRLFATFRNEAYKSSIELAKEKGAFPAFDAEKYSQEEFFQQLPPRIQNAIKKYGIRNAVMLTIAPCGTNSMVLNVSSGVEPIFSPLYERRFRDGSVTRKEVVADALFAQYYTDGKNMDHFVGAHDVSVQNHLAVQSTIQKYIDSAISKTTNLPKDYPVTELSEIILEHAPYVKGFTIYREGSKGNEPLKSIDLANSSKVAAAMKKAGIEVQSIEACRGGICEI